MYETLIIVLLISIALILYFYFNDMNFKMSDSTKFISEEVDKKFSEVSDKLNDIENTVNTQLYECKKKIQELHTLQHKIDEVNKINAQTQNAKFHCYNNNLQQFNDFVVNSEENSASPKINLNSMFFVNKNCGEYFMSSDEVDFDGSVEVIEIVNKVNDEKKDNSSKHSSNKIPTKNNDIEITIEQCDLQNEQIKEILNGKNVGEGSKLNEIDE